MPPFKLNGSNSAYFFIIIESVVKIYNRNKGRLLMPKVSVVVYGADVICASCVNAPSSQNTYEWLQSILTRKYPDIHFEYTYIDIEKIRKIYPTMINIS